MKNILIIKMWALGDVIMATPMLNALKSADQDNSITWLVDKTHADAVLRHPLIDEVIVMDTTEWRKQLKHGDLPAWLRTAWAMMRSLSRRHFDSVINCHPDKWWTFLFCLAPIRIALFPFHSNWLSKLLYTRAISRPTNPRVHNTIHYLMATRALGVADASLKMSVPGSIASDRFAESFLLNANVDLSKPIATLSPFSTSANRNWPPERYIELGRWLVDRCDAVVVLTAGPNQRSEIQQMGSFFNEGEVLVAADTTVAQYMALIQRSDLIICGDSSAMHIAAAVGVPYIALFGATPADERAPLDAIGRVLYERIECSPCDLATCSNSEFRKCMNGIGLSRVESSVREFLKAADD